MRFHPAFSFLLLASVPLVAAPPQTAPAKPPAPHPVPGVPATANAVPLGQGEGGYHRMGLPGPADKPLPYTVEVPTGWVVKVAKDSKEMPGLWLGPYDAVPPKDPRLIYVRVTSVKLDDPEKAVANIRANDAKNDSWSAPLVEVRDLEGLKGVLVRMDSGSGDTARSTLALKLPYESGGVDFLAGAPRAEFEKQLPMYQKILLSVRRASSGS
jgi:hypothetical protein